MKRIFLIGVIIISIFTINSLVHSIIGLWQKRSVMVNTKQELQKVKKEHDELTKRMEEVKDPQFIEKEARNKLFVVKPGEKVVVLPSKPQPSDVQDKKKIAVSKPHWQEWVAVFIKR